MTDFIKEHEERLQHSFFDEDFLSFHLRQIRFLQHERLVHLLVMLFVIFSFLLFLFLFLFFNNFLILIVFLLCLLLSVFYVLHYFKIENTVIKWYFTYNDNVRQKESSNKKLRNEKVK